MINKKLNSGWTPQGGDCFTWFAADKLGRLAMMSNNGFGGLPKSLLLADDSERLLNEISDFLFEESETYKNEINKKGSVNLHFYSSWFYRSSSNKNEVLSEILDEWKTQASLSYANLAANKGIFIFEALDHGNISDEIPVGYFGKSRNGDYYKHLAPTVFASIEDIPAPLRRVIVKSNVLDFSRTDLIAGNDVPQLFD